MFIPEIYAKAALTEDQILGKEKIGCNGIEIQLLSELVDGKVGNYKKAANIPNLDKLLQHNIKVIHAPILSKFGLSDIHIEELCDNDDFMLLDQVCYIANRAGEIHNRNVIVVVHSENYIEKMQQLGGTWKRMVYYVGCLLFKYSHIEFAIENVIPITNDGTFHLANNIYDDGIRIVEELRRELSTDRVGTVLDTCHAEISRKFYDLIKTEFGSVIPAVDLSMDNYFKMNKDVVKLFHFSNTLGNGYGNENHGAPFNESSKEVLYHYLDLYYKYNMRAPITLEVSETDFVKGDGYRESLKVLYTYFDKD